jgi:hypothetical protein
MKRLLMLIMATALVAGCSEKICPPCVSVVPPPCPDIQCPAEPSCIYNDGQGVKMIRFTHKDGRVCYGIKPYGKGEIVALHCPPEQ